MEKDSALYQLMDTRMHGIMNGIVSSDGEYQAILRKSDIYSGELDRMDLSKEIRLLIDRYVSEQNALGSRFGMLAHLLGFAGFPACRSHPPPWRASHRRTAYLPGPGFAQATTRVPANVVPVRPERAMPCCAQHLLSVPTRQ